MTKFLQILLLMVVAQWFETNGKPLFQGISFQRGFELNFKPLPRKPISFIKEKWSPFGVFGRKHAIQKRSLDSVMVPVVQAAPVMPAAPGSPVHGPRPAAPVFEHVDEIEHVETTPLRVLPPQLPKSVIPMLISSPVPPRLISPVPPPAIPSGPSFVSSSAPPHIIITPAPKPVLSDMPLSVPPVPALPVGIPPISSNKVLPPPRNSDVPPRPSLFTDISRAEPVREFMNIGQPIQPRLAVEEKVAPPLQTNSIAPEPPRNGITINDNSLIRGSKLALYFGTVFIQLMSQFLTNARATFDQMTNPPPIYNN